MTSDSTARRPARPGSQRARDQLWWLSHHCSHIAVLWAGLGQSRGVFKGRGAHMLAGGWELCLGGGCASYLFLCSGLSVQPLRPCGVWGCRGDEGELLGEGSSSNTHSVCVCECMRERERRNLKPFMWLGRKQKSEGMRPSYWRLQSPFSGSIFISCSMFYSVQAQPTCSGRQG